MSAALRELAWDQWSQMGVSAGAPLPAEQRASDPEALVLLTLEVGRDEPRLFDEMLDWLVFNDQLISIQRLRNLCDGSADRALVDAGLAWAALWRPRGRAAETSENEPVAREEPTPLFRGLGVPLQGLDATFARHGFARAKLRPSGKSHAPDYRLPINFAFRLRRLLGVGVKAEIVRTLLTIRAPRLQGQVIAASSGYSTRNVREGLSQLVDAGVVDAVTVGGERQYSTSWSGWTSLLGGDPPDLPFHHDWIQNLRALRATLRWLDDPALDELSSYLRGSSATTFLDSIDADLRYAGVMRMRPQSESGGWAELERVVRVAVLHARGRP